MPKARRSKSSIALSKLLFVRGDLLGRIADHDRAEARRQRGDCVVARCRGSALYIRARLAERFHRFEEASALLDRALAAGYPSDEIDVERGGAAAGDRPIRRGAGPARKAGEGRPRDPHARGARVAAGGNGSMGGGRNVLCGRARCGYWRLAFAVRPTALRMGRERDAPRRSRSCGSDLRRARRDPAGARSGRAGIAPRWRSRADSWTSRSRSITPLLEISDDPEYRADLCGDPGRAR